jgi:hypothetical protein
MRFLIDQKTHVFAFGTCLRATVHLGLATKLDLMFMLQALWNLSRCVGLPLIVV